MITETEKKLTEEAFAGLKDKVVESLRNLKGGEVLEITSFPFTYSQPAQMIIFQRRGEVPKVLVAYADNQEDEFDDMDERFSIESLSWGNLKHRLSSEYALKTYDLTIERLDKYGIINKRKLEALHQYKQDVKDAEIQEMRARKEREEYERLKAKFEVGEA